MKTVILFGSPRKEGNTIQLVSTLTESLKSKGSSVRMLYLNDMNVRPCQGCEACLAKGVCKINDDMKDIRKYVLESDLVVFASPVYWFNMSGQLKLAIDRFLAFMDEKYDSRIKGKKAVTLMTSGSDDPSVCSPAIDSFTKTFDLLGIVYAGRVEATGCTEKGTVREEFKVQVRKLAESLG
jgi:multimeric flavodoxin WrbA